MIAKSQPQFDYKERIQMTYQLLTMNNHEQSNVVCQSAITESFADLDSRLSGHEFSCKGKEDVYLFVITITLVSLLHSQYLCPNRIDNQHRIYSIPQCHIRRNVFHMPHMLIRNLND